MRLLSRVHEISGILLPVRELFKAPTLAGMARAPRAEMAVLAGDDLLDGLNA